MPMWQIVSSVANNVSRIEWQVIMGNMTVTGQQGFWGGTIAAISAVTVIATTSTAQAAPLENFRYNAQSNQLSFVLPDGVQPRYFIMAQPARIVMDIPEVQVGELPAEQTFSGAVARIQVTQVQPQLVRVVLEMSPQAVFARGQVSLENVGDAAPGKDLWLLMPLLANQIASQPVTLDSPTPSTATGTQQTSDEPNQSTRSAPPPASAKSSRSVAEGQPPALAKSVIAVPQSVPSVKPPPRQQAVIEQPPALAKSSIALPESTPTVELPPGMESVVGESPVPSEAAANAPASMPLPISPTVTDRPSEEEMPVAIEVPSAQPSVESLTPNVPPPPPLLQASSPDEAAVIAPETDTTAAMVTPDPVMRPDLQPVSEPPSAAPPIVSVPPLASITDATGESMQTPLPQTTSDQESFNAEEEGTPILVPEVASEPTTQADLPPLPPIAPRSGVRPVPSSAAIPSSVLPSRRPIITAARPAITTPTGLTSASIVEFGQFPSAPVSPGSLGPFGQAIDQATVTASVAPTAPVAPITPTPTAVSIVEFGQFPGSQNRAVTPVTAVTPVPTAGQLPSGHTSSSGPVRSTAPGTTGVVEFGQSLSGTPTMAPLTPGLQSALPSSAVIVAADSLPNGGVVIPSGTIFNLRYDQNETLKLKPGQRQQGILSLQSPIVDTRGQVVAPQGSIVLGEFDTNQDGSRFTTQALSIANRSLPFNAQSELLAVKKRVPSADRFLSNTGIGAGAGAVTGAIAGAFAPLLLGGAAAGAAITYIIAPKEATIQPGQILQVELVQDFFSNPQ